MRKPKSQPKFQPSPEQAAILQLPLTSGSITVIKAFAGTGKTATLRMLAEKNADKRILYIVFNKAMEEEAKKIFPRNVTCSTTHSLSFQSSGRPFQNHLGPLRSKEISVAHALPPPLAQDVVTTLNHWFCSMSEEVTDEHLPAGIQGGNPIIQASRRVWKGIVDQTNTLPMPHDGYQKLWSLAKPSCGCFDILLVDEAHDLNPVVLDFVLRSASKDKAAVVLVGDPHQSIYSWRGAIDAISCVESHANRVARLTWSFRFGEPIARDASTILRTFKGETTEIIGKGGNNNESYRASVLSRTNFSLIEHALSEVRSNGDISLHFAGTKKTENWDPTKPYKFDELLDALSLYTNRRDSIRLPYYRQFRDWRELIDFANAGDQDLSLLAKIVSEYTTSLPVSLGLIESAAVGPTEADITYSTAHRAKGLEWDYVDVLEDFQKPETLGTRLSAPRLEPPDRLKLIEEVNLYYVTFTRARKRLNVSPNLRAWLTKNQAPNAAQAPAN